MKHRILKQLKNADKPLTGEALGAGLNISKVAVWKHIRQLKAVGYDITASPKGYLLRGDQDLLLPFEFGARASRIHYLAETDSTMNRARELARQGCPAFTVVIAGKQLSGRGRLNRHWHSDEGGLYFTLVTRPDLPPMRASLVNFAASLSMVRTVRRLYAIDAKIKWPNDILVEERKLCGMLSEMETDSDRLSFVTIGMGVNVNNQPPELAAPAVALCQLLGHRVTRKELLIAFLDDFETALRDIRWDQVIGNWKEYALTLNRPVTIATTEKTYHGIARDIDQEGALILEMADGAERRVIYGDCFF